MNAPQIVSYLVQKGYSVDYSFSDETIWIQPAPPQKLGESVAAKESELITFFKSLDARPASGHAFATLANDTPEELSAEYYTCISCGVPWLLHGQPLKANWLRAKSADGVRLLLASPIDTAEATVLCE